jgi:hypothetical protein
MIVYKLKNKVKPSFKDRLLNLTLKRKLSRGFILCCKVSSKYEKQFVNGNILGGITSFKSYIFIDYIVEGKNSLSLYVNYKRNSDGGAQRKFLGIASKDQTFSVYVVYKSSNKKFEVSVKDVVKSLCIIFTSNSSFKNFFYLKSPRIIHDGNFDVNVKTYLI